MTALPLFAASEPDCRHRRRQGTGHATEVHIRCERHSHQMGMTFPLTKALNKSNQPNHQPKKRTDRRRFSRRPSSNVVWSKGKIMLLMIGGNRCSRSSGRRILRDARARWTGRNSSPNAPRPSHFARRRTAARQRMTIMVPILPTRSTPSPAMQERRFAAGTRGSAQADAP